MGIPHIPLVMLAALAGAPAELLAAEPGGALQPSLGPTAPDASNPTEPPEPVSEPPAVEAPPSAESAPMCNPECPAGAVCHEGQCLMTCDPSCAPGEVCIAGECHGTVIAAQPEASPTPATPAPKPDPDPPLPRLSLEVAPGVAACLGEGCRRIRVGDSQGSMGIGGSLALQLAYRMTPHFSLRLGELVAVHGNDITDGPTATWFVTHVGPRMHLSGGKWRAEPVLGFNVGYARSLIRWSNAGASADGLSLGVDLGVEVRLTPRISLGMTTTAILPYWARMCIADLGVRDCSRRFETPVSDLKRYFWTTNLSLVARLF